LNTEILHEGDGDIQAAKRLFLRLPFLFGYNFLMNGLILTSFDSYMGIDILHFSV